MHVQWFDNGWSAKHYACMLWFGALVLLLLAGCVWYMLGPASFTTAMQCCGRWVLCLPRPSGPEGVDGVGHVLSLGGAVLAGTATLVAFLQQTGTSKLHYLEIYIPGVVIPLAALLILMSLKDATKRAFYYDRPTRVFSRIVSAATFLLVCVVVWRGYAGALPGQPRPRPLQLAFASADKYKFESFKQAAPFGIKAAINIDRNMYPSAYPDPLVIRFSLRGGLRDRWDITQATLFEMETGKREVELQTVEHFPSRSPDDFIAAFDDALKDSKIYRVDLYLHSTVEYSDEQIKNDAKLITDGNGIRADGPISQ